MGNYLTTLNKKTSIPNSTTVASPTSTHIQVVFCFSVFRFLIVAIMGINIAIQTGVKEVLASEKVLVLLLLKKRMVVTRSMICKVTRVIKIYIGCLSLVLKEFVNIYLSIDKSYHKEKGLRNHKKEIVSFLHLRAGCQEKSR